MSINLSVSQVNQSVSQSISQSVNQSVSQSISQSINQSISQSGQPVSQSVNQSISQSVNHSRGANSRLAVSYNQSVTHTHAVRHHSIGLCCRKSVAVTAVCRTHTQCPLTRGISKLHSLPRALGLYYYTQSTHITMIPQSFELVGARYYGPISRGVRPAGHKGE